MVLISAISLIFLCSVHALPTTIKPSITLPIKRHRAGSANGLSNALPKRTDPINVPASYGEFAYFVDVTIGDQTVELVLDTISGNTWVGARELFTPSSTAQNLHHSFGESTGFGDVRGSMFSDKVSVGDAIVSDMWFGVTDTAGTSGIPFDGVLGLGFDNRSIGVIDGVGAVPTFTERLAWGSNLPNMFALSFARSNDPDSSVKSEITFGGFDASKFANVENPCFINPIGSVYWALGVDAISFGSQSLDGQAVSAVIGTSYHGFVLPADMFASLNSLTGITVDPTTGFGIFPNGTPQVDITFSISGVPFVFTPEQYLVSNSDAQAAGLPEGPVYTWISQTTSDFPVLGEKFLENFYAVFSTNYENISGNNIICLAPQA